MVCHNVPVAVSCLCLIERVSQKQGVATERSGKRVRGIGRCLQGLKCLCSIDSASNLA